MSAVDCAVVDLMAVVVAQPHRDRYMPHLDGLRFLAVLTVMVEHWVHDRYKLYLPWGYAGVSLFFVLSGFLITGILLRARDEAEAVGQPARVTLWRFYVRRFLRIFPLYYLAVVVAAIFLIEGRAMLWPNLLYVSNIAQFLDGKWAGSVALFWSLAVEEQFYLVWPFAILMLPRRLIPATVVATILLAPAFRFGMALAMPDRDLIKVLPISCLDALGLGSALALLRMKEGGSRTFERVCLLVGLPAWIALRLLVVYKLVPPAVATLEASAFCLVFTWLIARCADGVRGPAGVLLGWRPIVYLGTISYGLYVIHTLIYPIAIAPIRIWPVPSVMAQPALRFVVLLGCTIALASISWWLYERPINALKRHFPYVPGSVRAATADRAAPAELTPTSASAAPVSGRG